MKVLNQDIASLVKRIRRFKQELHKSVSANTSELNPHDEKRLVSYLEAIKAFKSWMIAQPILDMPESSPKEIELPEVEDFSQMENDDLGLIFKLLNVIEVEMINSQSARRPTGLIVHDSTRFDSYVGKIEAFLADFISKVNPVDLPESSPRNEATGAGYTGI